MSDGVEAKSELPATWNPVSRKDAAMRARTFANQASLLWTIESVVGYVTDLRREKPSVLPDVLISKIKSTKDKEEKLEVLSNHLGLGGETSLLLVRAAYVWRNRVTHIGANNRLDPVVERELKARSAEIEQDYQGLIITEMLTRIETNEPPRLKESAAISRAAGYLIRDIDAKAVESVDLTCYISDKLRNYLSEPPTTDQSLKRAVGLWGGTASANCRSISNYLLQQGLSVSEGAGVESDLFELTPKEAVDYLLP
ncbi:hypothetical protein ABDK96_05700 [Citricoccus nitrophenolicus]|uniref:Uncharacterized protein n=1 Tax=Citricoccus nitrophenolicus TaxID=863575 RepID=A0ABV0II69_9MICC